MNVSQNSTPRRAALAAAVAVVLLATACGTKEQGGAKSAASGPGGLVAAAKAEGEVDYWTAWGVAEPQHKIFQKQADAFTAQTGIKVNIKTLGRDAMNNLPANIASGAARTDLFDSGTDHVAANEAQHATQSLDDVLAMAVPGEKGRTVKDVLPAGALKSVEDKAGHVALVPHTLISTGIWYDAARSPDIAARPPRTWTDFIALLDGEKAAGRTPLAQDGLVNTYNAYWFYWALMRHGGPGSLAALSADPANWDKPAVLAAAKDVQQLADGGYFQHSYMGTKYPAAQNDWAAGKATLELNGTWLASETKPQAPAKARPSTFPYPAVAGGHSSVEVGALGWSLSAKAAHPHAAKLFLTYLLQKDVIAKIGTEALNIPSRADDPAPAALRAAQRAIVNATETNATYDGATADTKWWNDVFLPLDDKLLGKKISARDFVAQGKKKTEDALANS